MNLSELINFYSPWNHRFPDDFKGDRSWLIPLNLHDVKSKIRRRSVICNSKPWCLIHKTSFLKTQTLLNNNDIMIDRYSKFRTLLSMLIILILSSEINISALVLTSSSSSSPCPYLGNKWDFKFLSSKHAFKSVSYDGNYTWEEIFNPLSANPTKWSTIRRLLPMNCLSVLDHFIGLALKARNNPEEISAR